MEIEAPEGLGEFGLEEWQRVAPGLVTAGNVRLVTMLCQAWQRRQVAEATIREEGKATYIVRDQRGKTQKVVELPQVGIAQRAGAEYERLAKTLGLLDGPRPAKPAKTVRPNLRVVMDEARARR